MKKKEILWLVGLIALDQLTKYLATRSLSIGMDVEVIPHFFYLTLVTNTGAAWSILEGKMTLFYILTVIAIAAFLYFLLTGNKKDTLLRASLVCMLAGTTGNFIDRLVLKEVRDFLNFYIFGYDFPVFNCADMELCIGAGLLILWTVLDGRKQVKA